MAGRVKPGSGKPKPKKRGSNLPLEGDEALEAIKGIFTLKEKLKTTTGRIRKDIGDEYATVAKRFEVSTESVKLLVAEEELRLKKIEAFSRKNGADKAELEKLSQMFGDTPFGKIAAEAAALITDTEEFGGEGLDGPEED